jgi:hypothetical protein
MIIGGEIGWKKSCWNFSAGEYKDVGWIGGSFRAFVAVMTKGYNSLVGYWEEGRGDAVWGSEVCTWDNEGAVSWGCIR